MCDDLRAKRETLDECRRDLDEALSELNEAQESVYECEHNLRQATQELMVAWLWENPTHIPEGAQSASDLVLHHQPFDYAPECKDSPTGHCFYDTKTDPHHECCLVCGEDATPDYWAKAA